MSGRQELIANLGKVMQLAFVPKDFDAALKHWTEVVGAGPFFYNEHVKLQDVKYRGQPSDIDFSMAIGYWGDIQVELVRQHNDAASIYNPNNEAASDGLHHVCILVDDMARAREVCARVGATVLQEGKLPGGEVIYVDTGGGPGTIVEILQLPPGGTAGFDFMRAQHETWDGSDPVRGRDQR
jgi:hypothetical protein